MILSYAAFLCFLLGLGLCATAWWLDRRSPPNLAMATLGLLFAWWAFCSIFIYAAKDEGTAMVFYRLSFVGVFFVPVSLCWLYLALAGCSRRFRLFMLLPLCTLTVLAFLQCLRTNFRYTAFAPGPVGNVGIPAPDTFWQSSITWVLAVAQIASVIIMLRAAGREPSHRMRRLLGIVAVSFFASLILVGFALPLEGVLHWPPIAVLLGGPPVLLSYYLIVRYRYLRRSDPLIERQLGAAMDQAVLFLNEAGRIVSANSAASRSLSSDGVSLCGRDLIQLVDEPQAIAAEWELARSRRPLHQGVLCQVKGISVVIRISPYHDRFHDFVGAVAIVENLTHMDVTAEKYGISHREKEIIAMLRNGYRNQEIADNLFVTIGTVKNHIVHIFQKTGVTNRVELSLLFSEPESDQPGKAPQAKIVT